MDIILSICIQLQKSKNHFFLFNKLTIHRLIINTINMQNYFNIKTNITV